MSRSGKKASTRSTNKTNSTPSRRASRSTGRPACVVLAAGQSTRMKTSRPKVLHELGGKPLLEYVLIQARNLKAEKTIVVAGHEIEQVREYVDSYRSEASAGMKPSKRRPFERSIKIVEQTPQLGTGHAVSKALPSLRGHRGPVVVLYGDVPLLLPATLKKLVASFKRKKAAVAFLSMVVAEGGAYGRVIRDPRGSACEIVEHADATPEQRTITEVNAGIYCFDISFLRSAARRLGKDNAQGEFYLTDAVALAAADGLGVVTQRCDPEETLGINDRWDLAEAEASLQCQVVASLMMSGVTVTHPDSVVIHPTVEVGRDTVIGFGAHLRGDTKIGERCRIEAGSVLTDATIGDDVWVKPYTVVSEAEVSSSAEIGPFSHLRPGTMVGPGAKTGNFVEAKKARLGPGVKANHLSYLGDCEIGKDTNVGAGTITCNYDGVRKHRTVIGSRVMIGSDTQLVAPVTVGDGVTIGAGTTVLEDVPPGTVAVNPKSQRHMEPKGTARKPKKPKKTKKTKKTKNTKNTKKPSRTKKRKKAEGS